MSARDIQTWHGRPDYYETRYGPKPVHASVPNQLADGWRREHAWRCWSQLQLFVCWLVQRDALARLERIRRHASTVHVRDCLAAEWTISAARPAYRELLDELTALLKGGA